MNEDGFLRIEDAARILDVSKNTAYGLAWRYEQTHGREGLPVIRVGRSMRVPKAAFDRWVADNLKPDAA